jgi:hypothetical protein
MDVRKYGYFAVLPSGVYPSPKKKAAPKGGLLSEFD